MTTPTRRGRPTAAAAAELEDRIRHAALDQFTAHGFDGTSMEAVAAAANVSKRTLYAKYPDKRELFAQVLPWAMARVHWTEAVSEETDLRAALLDMGRGALARVTDPYVVQLTRAAITAAHNFPEFGRAAETMSWSPRLRSVAVLLERHHARGEISVTDPELTAEHFLALVTGFPSLLAIAGVVRDPHDEERHLEHAVDLFLNGVLRRQPDRRTATRGRARRTAPSAR